jgi:hypothetical protein
VAEVVHAVVSNALDGDAAKELVVRGLSELVADASAIGRMRVHIPQALGLLQDKAPQVCF